MCLGFFAMRTDTPRFNILENDQDKISSIIYGLILGVVFGLVNLGFFVYLYGEKIQLGNIMFGCLKALQPAIMEEIAYRLLFMGSSIILLRKYLPNNIADKASMTMAIIFHAIPHVYQIVLQEPITAIMSVIVLSVIFGLPMTIIAYKRGIDTSIIFHWTIDAIRFVLIG
jgi:hypothetical protein